MDGTVSSLTTAGTGVVNTGGEDPSPPTTPKDTMQTSGGEYDVTHLHADSDGEEPDVSYIYNSNRRYNKSAWSGSHSTRQNKSGRLFALGNEDITTNADVAKQMFLGSTWNGVGVAAYNGLALAGNFLRSLTNLVILVVCSIPAIFNTSAREHWIDSGVTMGGCMIYMGTNIKNIAYNAIRAIPIVGYPLSRGIDKLADEFYQIEYVHHAMLALWKFGSRIDPPGILLTLENAYETGYEIGQQAVQTTFQSITGHSLSNV